MPSARFLSHAEAEMPFFFFPVTFSSKRYQDSAAVLQPPAHAKEPSFTREQKKLGGIVTAPWCSFPSSSLLILAIIFFGSVVRYFCSTGSKKNVDSNVDQSNSSILDLADGLKIRHLAKRKE